MLGGLDEDSAADLIAGLIDDFRLVVMGYADLREDFVDLFITCLASE